MLKKWPFKRPQIHKWRSGN